ncbi:MAG: PepSY domain-containing protein [Gammaproteobacteria bacterium]
MMKSTGSRIGQKTWAIVATPVALIVAFTGLGFSGDAAMAQTKKTSYSSAADWNLKAANLQPHGVNPYYLPILPGSKYIMEEPNFSDEGDEGHYRKEVVVLDKTEPFDIPSIGGKFNCAIVEEKEFLDGKQFTKSHNYYCIDKVSNNLYVFGETAWESSSRESADMSDTVSESWRAGEPDEYGLTEPGMIALGTFNLGARYIIDGAEGLALVGGENMESGLTMATPAGTFPNCVRTREYDLLDPADTTDKVYCLDVGVVFDSSDGKLVESTALKNYKPRSVSTRPAETTAKAAPKIAEDEAVAIALKAVPGDVTDVSIEKKLGANRYVVEVLAKEDGSETDVIIDMATGKVLATEK